MLFDGLIAGNGAGDGTGIGNGDDDTGIVGGGVVADNNDDHDNDDDNDDAYDLYGIRTDGELKTGDRFTVGDADVDAAAIDSSLSDCNDDFDCDKSANSGKLLLLLLMVPTLILLLIVFVVVVVVVVVVVALSTPCFCSICLARLDFNSVFPHKWQSTWQRCK